MSRDAFFDPITDRFLKIVDIRKEVESIMKDHPPNPGESAAFREMRRNLVPVPPVGFDGTKCPPSGDGAALGTYFGPNIIGFNHATAIFWRIVAPQFLGGSSGDLLFLTSSNQASHGPEALVTYFNGLEAEFRVWDWAHPEDPNPNIGRFVAWIPYSKWGQHELKITVDGIQYSGLQVIDQTTFNGTQWVNEVFLYNGVTGTADLVWRWEHVWNTSEGCKFLFFGPCVEPKGHGYGTTNKIGYANAILVNDVTGKSLLVPNNSRLVQNGNDINKRFADPNHTVLGD